MFFYQSTSCVRAREAEIRHSVSGLEFSRQQDLDKWLEVIIMTRGKDSD